MKKTAAFFLTACMFLLCACSNGEMQGDTENYDAATTAGQSGTFENTAENTTEKTVAAAADDSSKKNNSETDGKKNSDGQSTTEKAPSTQKSQAANENIINGVDITKGSKVTMVNINKIYVHFHNDPSSIKYVEETANKLINASMTQFQAVCVISDFIVDNFSYSNGDENSLNEFTSKKTGLCADYASLFQYLCKQVGINASVLIGTVDSGSVTGKHAWNSVNIDGREYFVDVTFAETCNDKRGYMFLSDAQMNSNRTVITRL